MNLPKKELFDIPDGLIYLDGNSLGPLPKGVAEAVQNTVSVQWGGQLIKGWNTCHWMEQPVRVGNQIAGLIGAPAGSVVMGDTLSIKVFQALAAGLAMQPSRKIILSDNGNFPSDLYMAEGLVELKAQGYGLKVTDPENISDAIDESIAVVMLTEVDYRSGRRHAMQKITELAHAAGAVMVWDLAHSAGAIDVDIAASNCEFAVGCTYKYLNGGPGAPAFIYVRPDLAATVKPALSGWLGHKAPFAFEPTYTPAVDIERMRVGTPPVIQLAALEEALKIWDSVKIADVRAASIALSELFISEVEKSCPELKLISPRDSAVRGSQVSFAFDHGYAAMQALIARGVIGDFRAPNVMRFGFTPLYIDKSDVLAAVAVLTDILQNKLWDAPEYLATNRVT